MQLKETTGRAHTCIFSSDMKFISFDLFLLVIRKCRLIHWFKITDIFQFVNVNFSIPSLLGSYQFKKYWPWKKKTLDTLGDIYLIQSNEFTCNCTHFKKYLHTLVKVENIFKAGALEIKYFSNSQTIQRCFDIKIVTVISLIPTVCTIK